MDGKAVRAVVRSGYDAAAEGFLELRAKDGQDRTQLEALQQRLNRASRVLDAGCGCGVPVAELLHNAGHWVVGLDLSVGQLKLARQLDAGFELVQADLAGLPFNDGSFEAVVSFYAVIHVPREEHRTVLEEFRRVLVRGGLLLACMGWTDLPADQDPHSWLGAPMFWSHFDADTKIELFTAAGLVVSGSEEVLDPNGHGSHQFVLAAKP